MSKPRVFIGSSIEGLSVAYAVQQNLLHEAEVTVWDQGVFELSRTTIESLTQALSDNDFAVFVFSADDLARIRDVTSPIVRDNVLFEFGLFIGRLGRDRVFFLLPIGGELHLPTDLLGVTPGRYESSRSDGSMQAATGAVCHQIRLQMKATGVMPGRLLIDATEGAADAKSERRSWIQDFVLQKYDSAKAMLESELKNQTGIDALVTNVWILYCEQKQKSPVDIEPLIKYATEHSDCSRVLSAVSASLRFEGHARKAVELLSPAQAGRPNDSTIAIALALCYTDEADNAGAIAELQRIGPDDFPDVAIDLAEAFEREEKKDEALRTIQRCHAKHPGHINLRYKYARLAQDLDQHIIAASLLHGLTAEDSTSIDYWGYLGNSCIQLDLYDIALCSYRRAEKLMREGEGSQWIIANIGNLLSNKGLATEACDYLERAIGREVRSEYAHDRLAGALKKKNAEEREFEKKCAEGKRLIREAAQKAFDQQVSAVSPKLLGNLTLP